jgi:hypothetical protein
MYRAHLNELGTFPQLGSWYISLCPPICDVTIKKDDPSRDAVFWGHPAPPQFQNSASFLMLFLKFDLCQQFQSLADRCRLNPAGSLSHAAFVRLEVATNWIPCGESKSWVGNGSSDGICPRASATGHSGKVTHNSETNMNIRRQNSKKLSLPSVQHRTCSAGEWNLLPITNI